MPISWSGLPVECLLDRQQSGLECNLNPSADEPGLFSFRGALMGARRGSPRVDGGHRRERGSRSRWSEGGIAPRFSPERKH